MQPMWKCEDLRKAPFIKAKKVQRIQDEQALLKAKELEVHRLVAQSRGISAAQQMQFEQLKKKEPCRDAQEARQKALTSEKERAKRVASRTPPPMELPVLPQTTENAEFYDTKYIGTWTKSSEPFKMKRVEPEEKGAATLQAVLLREEKENIQQRQLDEMDKRNDQADQRFLKALNKQKLFQNYDVVLSELEAARQEDISRRKRALITRNFNKNDLVESNQQRVGSNKSKKLEKEVQSLLFEKIGFTMNRSTVPIISNASNLKSKHFITPTSLVTEIQPGTLGSYDKSKGLLEQMRSERQKCMKIWRSQPTDPEVDCLSNEDAIPNLLTEDSGNLSEKNSPDILNEGLLEFRFTDVFGTTPDDFHFESQESVLPEIILNEIADGSSARDVHMTKEPSYKLDATTQTANDDLRSVCNRIPTPPITNTSTKESEYSSSVSINNKQAKCSDSLRLGSNVAVPALSQKVVSVSGLIQKAALQKFGTVSLVTGVTHTKLPDFVKPKLFGDLLEPQKGVTVSKSEKNNLFSELRMFPDISNAVVKQNGIAASSLCVSNIKRNRTLVPSQCVSDMKRKVISAPSPCASEQQNEISFENCEIEIQQPANSVLVTETNLPGIKMDSKLPLFSCDLLSAAHSNVSSPVQSPKEMITEIQVNVQDNSHKSYFCNLQELESATESSPEITVISNDAYLHLPMEDHDKATVDSKSSASLQPENQFKSTTYHQNLSDNSLSTEVDSSIESICLNAVTIPNYLRHSLSSQLRQNDESVSEENIHRLLQSIVAFENADNYIRPPPPVSFRGMLPGMSEIYPHELSTIIEVDTPQNSFLRTTSRSWQEAIGSDFTSSQERLKQSESQDSVLLSSPVTCPEILSKISYLPPTGSDNFVLSSLSPPLSIPSTCSTISNAFKKSAYSSLLSSSSASSNLTEAFRSDNIKTHSTPIKERDPIHDFLDSNISKQTITLIEDFSLDTSTEINILRPVHTTPVKTQAVRKENNIPLSKRNQIIKNFIVSPQKNEVYSSAVLSHRSLCSRGIVVDSVSTQSSPSSPSLKESTISSNAKLNVSCTVSDSLLSFMQHEQSIENQSNSVSIFD